MYDYSRKYPVDINNKLKKNWPKGKVIDQYSWDRYKIIIDIDGSSYSERFPKMLKLASVVIKIAAFYDIGTLAVKPWEHFIPVKMDLSDFREKLSWAKNNDKESEKIGKRGQARSF